MVFGAKRPQYPQYNGLPRISLPKRSSLGIVLCTCAISVTFNGSLGSASDIPIEDREPEGHSKVVPEGRSPEGSALFREVASLQTG